MRRRHVATSRHLWQRKKGPFDRYVLKKWQFVICLHNALVDSSARLMVGHTLVWQFLSITRQRKKRATFPRFLPFPFWREKSPQKINGRPYHILFREQVVFLQIVCFLRGDTFVNSFGKIYVNICPKIVFRAVLIFCRFLWVVVGGFTSPFFKKGGRDCF